MLVLLLIVTSAGLCRWFCAIRRICGRHGRGEQGDLPLLRRLLEDPFDIVDETHAQHLVGLVEHDVLERRELESALLDVVHDAAGCADHDVHAAAQAVELRRVALAAVDRHDVKAFEVRRVALKCFGNLNRQLARRHEHQRLRRLLLQVDARKDRQGEGGSLAGAGLRLADHVAPGEQVRDGCRLDRRRRFVADLIERFDHRFVERKIAEIRDGRGRAIGVQGSLGEWVARR